MVVRLIQLLELGCFFKDGLSYKLSVGDSEAK